MRIVPVPCLRDNYAYLLIDDAGERAVVVDPSEVDPVLAASEREGVRLTGIWATHHHWDHTGGIEGLCERAPGLEVLGSEHDREAGRIPRQTRGLRGGDALAFDGRDVTLIDIPGHTLGAIAYVVDGHLFSGDTLFLAGCGRVFEGTMEMMARSLLSLRELPADTRVWCGHEYTVRNLEFALTIEPDSEAVRAALGAARGRREAGEPTVPGRLADELETNPFLRFDLPAVAKGRAPVEAFTAIRGAKDAF